MLLFLQKNMIEETLVKLFQASLMKNELMVKEIFKNKCLKINKIYNENCLEFMDKISDESIDLIFADPPYNLSKSNFKIKL